MINPKDIEFKTSIIEDEISDMIKKKFENKSIDQFFEETFGKIQYAFNLNGWIQLL